MRLPYYYFAVCGLCLGTALTVQAGNSTELGCSSDTAAIYSTLGRRPGNQFTPAEAVSSTQNKFTEGVLIEGDSPSSGGSTSGSGDGTSLQAL